MEVIFQSPALMLPQSLVQLDVFRCHRVQGVSCLATAQEGPQRLLLTGSYDGTVSVCDANSGLVLRTLQSHCMAVLCVKVGLPYYTMACSLSLQAVKSFLKGMTADFR